LTRIKYVYDGRDDMSLVFSPFLPVFLWHTF